MHAQKTFRLVRSQVGLLVIDIQDRLLPQIFEKERLLKNSLLLIQGATILGLPIAVTEQYRKGLGLTVPEIAAVIKDFAPVEKVTFSSCGAEGVIDSFKKRGISQLLLCGMEAHVCVMQTCLDLLDRDLQVIAVSDAISSRNEQNLAIGIQRMRDSGAVIMTTEMVLFELLERAGTNEFKQVLALVR